MSIPISSDEYRIVEAETIGVELLQRVEDFLEREGDLPQAYYSEGVWGTDPEHPHPEKRLNVNDLLDLFDHLHLEVGYDLDYIYLNYKGQLGAPAVYVRRIWETYRSKKAGETGTDEGTDNLFLEHFYFDPTPMGYLQLAVFRVVANQFYLFWHACYSDDQFVFSRNEAARILNELERNYGYSPSPEKSLEGIDFCPRLKQYSNQEASLRAVTFSKWSGFSAQEWRIALPAIIQETNKEVLIPYDCGITF